MKDRVLDGEYQLRDGTRVRIRALCPDDARTLQDAFRQLSPESRRRRFLRPRQSLSDSEIRYFTEADGQSRLALGAVRLDADGWECEGLGMARYACLPDQPEVAEPSIMIVDSAQGQGLGRLLAEELIRAASANGVKTFRALLANDHEWLRERIRRTYPDAQLTRRGHVLGADFALPAIAVPRSERLDADHRGSGDSRYWSMLRWVAEGAVQPEKPSVFHRTGEKIRRRFNRIFASRGAAPKP